MEILFPTLFMFPYPSIVWTDKSTAANIGSALTTDAIISSSVHHLEATVIPVVTLITLVVCAAAVGIIWRRFVHAAYPRN